MHEVTLTWMGGEHTFALRLGELRALQEKCDAGPLEIMHRIVDGRWRVDDLFETLRLGLIGGGMAQSEARKLVSDLFDQHPITRFAFPAQMVLIAALSGPLDDDDEEEDAEPEKAPGADAGISDAIMAPVQ